MLPTGPVPAGLAVLDLAQEGRFAEIREMFAPPLRAMVTPESLEAAWAAELARYGPVVTVGAPVSDPAGPGMLLVKIPVTFDHGELAVLVAVSDAGWVSGVQFAPIAAAKPAVPWQPPDYADPASFDEQDVMIGVGALAVPGTLSMPHDRRRHAAVVLLAGSGPNDRDETIGRNKVLKDLAWGLASQGVAVVRFDKVTYAHGRQVASDSDFTVVDEYIPHAVAAVHLLRQHPAVDGTRIFVLGHSLGGTVAPRVAVDEPAIAGLVILAGGAQPLHWAAVRQFRHLASLDPDSAAAYQPSIDTMTKQAQMVDSPDLSPSTPASDLPFGVPAAYWLDLRGYDPVAVAATLDKPIFIQQGGRDYQVTIDDDLARWQAGLANHPDVTIRVYGADNHMFFVGTGPARPAEYEPAQHMDPTVVADIAHWLTTTILPARGTPEPTSE